MPITESTLTRLADEAAIRDAILHFGDYASRGVYDAFEALWAPDAVWVIGPPANARLTGVADIVAHYHHLWDGKTFFQQLASPGAIQIKGDEATAQAIIDESAIGANNTFYRTKGVYFDKLRRAGEKWIFTERVYEYQWLDLSPFSGEAFKLTPRTS